MKSRILEHNCRIKIHGKRGKLCKNHALGGLIFFVMRKNKDLQPNKIMLGIGGNFSYILSDVAE